MAYTALIIIGIALLVSGRPAAYSQIKTKKYDEKANRIKWPAAFDPKRAGFYVYNEIFIDAPPEVVWNILIDATKWHTFYKGVERPVTIMDTTRQMLTNNVSFSLKTMGISFVPVVREFVPNERLAWEINTRKLQAYHAWLIVPEGKGCRLITPEAQNGFLTLLQKIFQPNKLLNLHEHWLEVIKARAENAVPG